MGNGYMNIYLHFISFLFSTLRSHKELKSFIVENEDQFSMHTRCDPVAKASVTLYRDPTTWPLRFDFFQRALESPENIWNSCKTFFIFHEMEMSQRPYGDRGLSTERAGARNGVLTEFKLVNHCILAECARGVQGIATARRRRAHGVHGVSAAFVQHSHGAYI